MSNIFFLLIILSLPFLANAFIRIIACKWVSGIIMNVCAMMLIVAAFSIALDIIAGNSMRNDFTLLFLFVVIFGESAVCNIIIKKKNYL